jgi:hypothetical protein
MNTSEFRKLALSFSGAEERQHMDHPDFRVGGKIFATLGYPDKNFGMVKLFPDQQAKMLRADPQTFAPAAGAWGTKGATLVNLKPAKKTEVREALAMAWQNLAEKQKSKRGKKSQKPRPSKSRKDGPARA